MKLPTITSADIDRLAAEIPSTATFKQGLALFAEALLAQRDAQVRAALQALPIAGYAVSLPGKDLDHALFLDRERAQQQATKAHGLVFELVTRPVLQQPLGEL